MLLHKSYTFGNTELIIKAMYNPKDESIELKSIQPVIDNGRPNFIDECVGEIFVEFLQDKFGIDLGELIQGMDWSAEIETAKNEIQSYEEAEELDCCGLYNIEMVAERLNAIYG